ncbi:tyrosine-type recombinase/integrase [Chloroflexota bacterium]
MRTSEVLEKYLAGKEVRPATETNYRTTFKRIEVFTEYWFTEPIQINEFLKAQEVADQSKRLYWKVIKTCSRFMWKHYDLPDLTTKADSPKVKRKERRYFSAKQILEIISACSNDFEKLLIMVLVDSSCRIGELTRLTKDRIYATSFTCDVFGKTGERTYRCDNRLCSIMSALGSQHKYIFGNSKPPTSAALKQRVTRVIKRAGITGSKLGAHTPRHSSTSIIAQETGSVLAVKSALQHDDIETSMKYIHDIENMKADRVSPLEVVARDNLQHADKKDIHQLMLSDGQQPQDVVTVDDTISDNEVTELMFREVKPNISIRPLLKSADLQIIRLALIELVNLNGYSDTSSKARDLFKRILRKID